MAEKIVRESFQKKTINNSDRIYFPLNYAGRLTLIFSAVLIFFIQGCRIYFSLGSDVEIIKNLQVPSIIGILITPVIFLLGLIPFERWAGHGKLLAISAIIVFFAKIGMVSYNPAVKFVSSILGISGAVLFIKLIWLRLPPRNFSIAVLLAGFVLTILMASNSAMDKTIFPDFLVYQIIISVALILATFPFIFDSELSSMKVIVGSSMLRSLSFGGYLYLLLNFYSLPQSLSVWTGTGFNISSITLVIITGTMLLLLIANRVPPSSAKIRFIFTSIWIVLSFVIANFYQETITFILLAISTFCFHYSLMFIFTIEHKDMKISDKKAKYWTTLALIFFILLSLTDLLAVTNHNTLPWLKGCGIILYLIAGISIATNIRGEGGFSYYHPTRFGIAGIICLSVIIYYSFSSIMSIKEETEFDTLPPEFIVGTYNLHYGFDDRWHYKLEEMADVIEQSNAEIVFLQGVDEGRASSYSIGMATWLSQRLGMQVEYLPCTEKSTGIAVLYRYQISEDNPVIKELIDSDKEQTGLISFIMESRQKEIQFAGTSLGSEVVDRKIQLNHIFSHFINDQSRLIVFGADFNMEPDINNFPGYYLITGEDQIAYESLLYIKPVLNDSFMQVGKGSLLTSPAINPVSRTDMIFTSGLQTLDAWVLPDDNESQPSNHRMAVVNLTYELAGD